MPSEDVDIYRSSPKALARDTVPSGKQSKWQPLATVDPSPVAEADPFSLGDSEDEKESKDRVGGKESRMDDAETLRVAAADVPPVSPTVKPEPAEVSGTKE
jgi:CDK inhibitor PHO81